MSLTVMIKNVNAALKAKVWTFEAKAIGPKAKVWTFEAKAIGPKAKAIKFGLEATLSPRDASRPHLCLDWPRGASKAWPRVPHHCIITELWTWYDQKEVIKKIPCQLSPDTRER